MSAWLLPIPVPWARTSRGCEAQAQLPARRQAALGIFKGLMEEEGVFAVQVDGALVMGERLAFGSIRSCQEVGQLVHGH